MISMRSTFLNFFVIVVGLLIGAFFAAYNGVFATIWNYDQSYMTSVIGAILLGALYVIGLASWQLGSLSSRTRSIQELADLGWDAMHLAPLVGLFGTALGLSLESELLTSGTSGLSPLRTALFPTASGIFVAIIIYVVTRNLQREIDRRNSGAFL